MTSRGISWRERETADDFVVKRDSRHSRVLQSATATIKVHPLRKISLKIALVSGFVAVMYNCDM